MNLEIGLWYDSFSSTRYFNSDLRAFALLYSFLGR